jgi:hypothetical protein
MKFIVLQHFTMQCFWKKITAEDVDPQLKPVLTRLCSLFGLWRLEQYIQENFMQVYCNI